MKASCDGLLVLSVDYTHFCIYNPATRQYARLPVRDFWLVGMYSHNPTGDYRLLLYKMADGEGTTTCHVFTIGSGQPPRCIECPDAGKLCARVSVLLHGSLHWYNGQMIMAYDTTAESFRQMRSPIVPDYAGLFEIGGMLGMSSLNDGAVNVWVMQDYGSEFWAFKHRVELQVPQLSLQFGELYDRGIVVVPSGDGDVLVLVNFGHWLLQIDTSGKLVASFRRTCLGPSEVRLKQSLVQHTFFPLLEGYVVNANL